MTTTSSFPRRSRGAAALLAAIVLLGTISLLPGPARAQAAPGWVPFADATIHPGVQTVTGGGQCTANFVFTDDAGAVYLGQAAHCASDDGSDETDGCAATTQGIGVEVQIDGATRPGVLAYSSWDTMQAVGETDPNACRFNDLALVRIDPVDVPLVNPSIPHWGGPHGIVASTAPGDTVHTYGNSGLRPGLNAKTGTSQGQSGEGWTHTVRTVLNPGIPGDSGSAFIDAQGRAFGVLSTLEVLPNIGANGVSDLSRMLAYLEAHTDLDVTLADGTLIFDADGASIDTAAGQPPAPDDRVQRLSGDSRVETAVAASRDAFGMLGAGAVVLGRADVAADALAGTALAADRTAPVLLTGGDSLHPATEAEIQRVLPPGGTVYLLGGTAAIGEAVASSLTADGYQVVRLAGESRIETAIAVADAVTDAPDTVLLADGAGFTDALVAGPAADAAGGVVVLTDGTRSHPAVDAYLAEHGDAEVVTVGATATTAYPGRRAVGGQDPVQTAVAVAAEWFPTATVVGIARVDVFADALAGGAHIAQRGGPVLLSSSSSLSTATGDYLRGVADTVDDAVLYGGTAALSATVADQVRDAIS
ncbi:cell wall-binding repeat-containing protein [Euzebya rosea]|uniref:cell wall-binding repeat-containing protein n=1 Tax=Euzebya rosea TaxID=2052804 RepID=UPI000D3EAFAF|nr:cell wall-binding repeat-containing protein [Euzebya rosea]